MNKSDTHVWQVILLTVIVLLSGSASPVLTQAEDLTLSAAFQDPTGVTGTFAFTFELE